jgi:hypothetical protein
MVDVASSQSFTAVAANLRIVIWHVGFRKVVAEWTTILPSPVISQYDSERDKEPRRQGREKPGHQSCYNTQSERKHTYRSHPTPASENDERLYHLTRLKISDGYRKRASVGGGMV